MLSSEVTKILDDLSKRFGVAIDWTSKNIMPYVQDLLHRITRYEIITSSFWILLAIAIAVPSILLMKWDWKNIENEHDMEADGVFLTIGGLMLLACIIVITAQAFDIIRAITIPEMIWQKYLKDIIK